MASVLRFFMPLAGSNAVASVPEDEDWTSLATTAWWLVGGVMEVQEILDNEYAEIRVEIGIKTDVKIRNNRPDMFILDKKKNKITLIKVGITFQDLLQIVETEKLGNMTRNTNKYDGNIEFIEYKKIVKAISFARLRGLLSEPNTEESWVRASMSVIIRAYMLWHQHPFETSD
ncbi:hypothetical protein CWI37_0201p0010 [Hamiltosporidium tvaerminnensis]|uniref:Uncharacterized protein n=1 Tax=Hamiltosporidium tvaerminnensis TaxID=1176355 RepID=A0A4Q9L8D9_9MICR|nr:hypothetical protein CWI37_0201p0010 [Hamiltosporidium tvaerminnensis]